MNLYYDSTRNQIVLDTVAPLTPAENKQLFYSYQMVRAAYLYQYNRLPRKDGALYITVRGSCGMACKFCYVANKTVESFDLQLARELLSEHRFKHVELYGGDALDDIDYLAQVFKLLDEFQVESTLLLTGGRNLTANVAAMLNEFAGTNAQKLRMQISVEPREFGQRFTQGGRHIQDVLEQNDAVKLLSPNIKVAFRLVIPTKATLRGPSFMAWLNWLEALKGDRKFTCSYTMETDSDCPKLPDLVDMWARESDIFTQGNKNRWRVSLFSSILSHFGHARYGAGCGAALNTAPGVGTDHNIYLCHHNAINQTAEYADPAKRDDIILAWSKDMLGPECLTCRAKYICGGICYLQEKGSKNATCVFYRKGADPARLVRYACTTGAVAAKVVDKNQPALLPEEQINAWVNATTLVEAEKAVANVLPEQRVNEPVPPTSDFPDMQDSTTAAL